MTFDFIGTRIYSYVLGGALALFGVIAFFTLPLNLGIDMTGGTRSEFRYDGKVDIQKARSIADTTVASLAAEDKSRINAVSVYPVSGESAFVVEAGFYDTSNVSASVGSADVSIARTKSTFQDKLVAAYQQAFPGILSAQYVNIGESFGDYIQATAFRTLALCILAIAAYLMWSFRQSVPGVPGWLFGVITIITLAHDVLATFGLYVLATQFMPDYKIDVFFVTALLTILGYVINDRIVIFDWIRSSLRDTGIKSVDLKSLINTSLVATMSRSIYTAGSVFICLFALLFFGPISLGGFVFALIVGIAIGTFSSVMIAGPMLYDFTRRIQATQKSAPTPSLTKKSV
jgi:preprotein translocase SecF subunit